mgnify:CR=1 FL=1
MNRLVRALLGGAQIQPGEGRTVGLLLAHSLGLGVFRALFLAVASALFLAQWEVRVIPAAYIASAVVGYLAVSLFAFLQKRLPFLLPLLLRQCLLHRFLWKG